MKGMSKGIDGERVLLLFFIVLSAYMYVEAYSFPIDATRFPQLTALVVIIASFLLLVREHVPQPLQPLVSDEAEFMGSLDYDEEGIEPPEAVDDPPAASGRSRGIPSGVFTTVIIGAYVLAGYLFGLLWMTPVFVAFYMWWYDVSRAVILLMVILSTITVYLFMYFLYAPFDRGLLFDPGALIVVIV